MAINQSIDLGTINRIRGSIVLPSNTNLNITAKCINQEGIVVEPMSGGGDLLEQMSGAVVSLKPYVLVRVTFGVLRTLSIGTLWYKQWLSNSAIGDLNITPVTSVAPEHYITNAVITGVGRIGENGATADLPITLTGSMIINSELWSAV